MNIWLLFVLLENNAFPYFNTEIQQWNWAAVFNELSNLQGIDLNAFGVTNYSMFPRTCRVQRALKCLISAIFSEVIMWLRWVWGGECGPLYLPYCPLEGSSVQIRPPENQIVLDLGAWAFFEFSKHSWIY